MSLISDIYVPIILFCSEIFNGAFDVVLPTFISPFDALVDVAPVPFFVLYTVLSQVRTR